MPRPKYQSFRLAVRLSAPDGLLLLLKKDPERETEAPSLFGVDLMPSADESVRGWQKTATIGASYSSSSSDSPMSSKMPDRPEEKETTLSWSGIAARCRPGTIEISKPAPRKAAAASVTFSRSESANQISGIG